ncbi:MAG: HAMP domain-containing histidine kinase [Anaerolineae bacterium]|nr:HAMP domain-containing histidine kinase [Anaerolineae bacterium]
MTDHPLHTARTLLDDLKARAGTLAPAQIGSQIDDVLALLDRLESAPATTPPLDATQADAAPDAEHPINSKFISIGVHEMRIPLTSIRGYADMLGKGILGPLNEQQTQFLEIIRTNTARLDRLIADFNDYAKIQDGNLHLDRKMDTAKNILLAAQKRVGDLAEERGTPLTFDVPDGLPILNADGPRVAQALAYLIENALLYSPAGSPVSVTARGEGNTLRVSVTDQGLGMTPDDLAHLGEAFWRAEHEAIRSEKGHGLGYAVARGIIAAHGGQMHVESTFEGGSTFEFTLPGMS